MATGSSGPTFTAAGVWGKGGRGGLRLKVAYCFPILCLHTMIVDLQHRWHILMMDGAAEAGGRPAAIVRSLIK